MNTFLLVISILITIFVYLFVRNDQVHSTRIEWARICHFRCMQHLRIGLAENTIDASPEWQRDDEHLNQLWDEISNISYERMLYSLKPLTPEAWLTDEQLKFLKGELDVLKYVSESSENISTS